MGEIELRHDQGTAPVQDPGKGGAEAGERDPHRLTDDCRDDLRLKGKRTWMKGTWTSTECSRMCGPLSTLQPAFLQRGGRQSLPCLLSNVSQGVRKPLPG